MPNGDDLSSESEFNLNPNPIKIPFNTHTNVMTLLCHLDWMLISPTMMIPLKTMNLARWSVLLLPIF